MEQELLTLSEDSSSPPPPPLFCGIRVNAQSSVFCVNALYTIVFGFFSLSLFSAITLSVLLSFKHGAVVVVIIW